MSKLKDFPMGAPARDVLSGFEGVIICKLEWLTGCDQIGLRPTALDKDGKPHDAQYFDITRIKVTGSVTKELQKVAEGKLQSSDEKPVKGGPQDRPSLDRG